MRVALTFDTEFPGRPTVAGVEDRLLASLAAADIRATFFLQGRWVRANPDQARRIADAGHLVANHSNFHAPMDGLDPEDWNEAHDAEDVARFVLDGVRARKEDTIVLLHGWPAATAEALPRILDGLGDEFVTVDALIES